MKTGNTGQVFDIGLDRLLAHVDLDDALARNWLRYGVLLAGTAQPSTINAARQQAGMPT